MDTEEKKIAVFRREETFIEDIVEIGGGINLKDGGNYLTFKSIIDPYTTVNGKTTELFESAVASNNPNIRAKMFDESDTFPTQSDSLGIRRSSFSRKDLTDIPETARIQISVHNLSSIDFRSLGDLCLYVGSNRIAPKSSGDYLYDIDGVPTGSYITIQYEVNGVISDLCIISIPSIYVFDSTSVSFVLKESVSLDLYYKVEPLNISAGNDDVLGYGDTIIGY